MPLDRTGVPPDRTGTPPGQDRGTPPGQDMVSPRTGRTPPSGQDWGTPHGQNRGTPGQGVPLRPDRIRVRPHPQGYAADGTPLAVMQEDFLILLSCVLCVFLIICICFNHFTILGRAVGEPDPRCSACSDGRQVPVSHLLRSQVSCSFKMLQM